MDGGSRLVVVHRQNKAVWIALREATPAELSILRAFAKAAESKQLRERNRVIRQLAKKRRK
jgi:hypothetical protein